MAEVAFVVVFPLVVLERGLFAWAGVEHLGGILHDNRPSVAVILILSFLLQLGAEDLYSGMIEHVVREGTPSRRGLWSLFRSLPLLRMMTASILLAMTVTFGTGLLVVVGLAVFTLFQFAPLIVNVERKRLVPAFLRSLEIGRGNRVPVLAVAAVITGLDAFNQLVVLAFVREHLAWWVEVAADGLLEIGLTAFSGLVTAVLYFELLRLRGERGRPSGQAE